MTNALNIKVIAGKDSQDNINLLDWLLNGSSLEYSLGTLEVKDLKSCLQKAEGEKFLFVANTQDDVKAYEDAVAEFSDNENAMLLSMEEAGVLKNQALSMLPWNQLAHTNLDWASLSALAIQPNTSPKNNGNIGSLSFTWR